MIGYPSGQDGPILPARIDRFVPTKAKFFGVIFCHMTGSASGQDVTNPVFWLTTRAGKTGLSCPLCSREKKAPDEGFHSSLKLQSDTFYKLLVTTSV